MAQVRQVLMVRTQVAQTVKLQVQVVLFAFAVPVGQFWVHTLVAVKKKVLLQVEQFEADPEQEEQLVMQAEHFHVELSANVPVTPVQSLPHVLPLRKVLLTQAVQLVADSEQLEHGLVQTAHTPELL